MLTRENVQLIKQSGHDELATLIRSQTDEKSIITILENIGRMPSKFDGTCLLPFLESKNEKLRLSAVKSIGKLSNDNFLKAIWTLILLEENTLIRREAVSTIGRMRSKKAINLLLKLISDDDPKVVMQVIRALLVFKDDNRVWVELLRLIDHPNEMIQSVMKKEMLKQVEKIIADPVNAPEEVKNVVVLGDVLATLNLVKDESIHLTFTSPPYYNARDYSIYPSYKEYLLFLQKVFLEVFRITKEGRFFILNTSPVIVPRVSRQYSSKRYPIPFDIHHLLTEMGWEFIDDIIWMKPEASVKNRNAGFLMHRKPLGYKPNPITEYLMVYRKQSDKLIDWNMRAYSAKVIKQSKVNDKYETSNVWKIDPTFDKVHSAVFPIELCNRVIKFYSYIGDVVFDPFAGSGTLGQAALNLGRLFFLTEKEKDYFNRMKELFPERSLFSNTPIPRFLKIEEFQKLVKDNYHDFKQ